MDFELERQSHFAKLGIYIFDPILKTLRVEISHIGNEYLAHEVADNFPLAFGKGMHRAHACIFEHNQCPAIFLPSTCPLRIGFPA